MRWWLALVLVALSACTFEPLGASLSSSPDATIVQDSGPNTGDAQPADANADAEVGMDVVIEPDAGEDGGVPSVQQIYVPVGGGGQASSSTHRARIQIGGSPSASTATSSGHRVHFGPLPRR